MQPITTHTVASLVYVIDSIKSCLQVRELHLLYCWRSVRLGECLPLSVGEKTITQKQYSSLGCDKFQPSSTRILRQKLQIPAMS
jgi:hypothetical protein